MDAKKENNVLKEYDETDTQTKIYFGGQE